MSVEKTHGLSGSTPFIFLAEDDIDDQELLIEALTSFVPDMRVGTAANGKKALNELLRLEQAQLPCLIIVDYNLPEVNGGEILKQLAGEARYASIPKVVWSTSNSPLYRQICMDLGARAYFVKPSDIKGIERMAQEMLVYCNLVHSS
ncbi:response regulator [Flaviaesturariibacter flavus]|uniref:Response regulator n=1 Tax=Flaviaesturariibacter flavus TaxID=2502780 RepID=A0A4V2NWH4_9BACT|nr:response regulator [Flaviaesturariibacter flavus]TCJ17402.1 response regulator [Flaviaesturariibacter flavus]